MCRSRAKLLNPHCVFPDWQDSKTLKHELYIHNWKVIISKNINPMCVKLQGISSWTNHFKWHFPISILEIWAKSTSQLQLPDNKHSIQNLFQKKCLSMFQLHVFYVRYCYVHSLFIKCNKIKNLLILCYCKLNEGGVRSHNPHQAAFRFTPQFQNLHCFVKVYWFCEI